MLRFSRLDVLKFLSIIKRLEKDRERKGITPEMQRPNIFSNIREEQHEIQVKGLGQQNLYEVIDGFMDIVVYLINASGYQDYKKYYDEPDSIDNKTMDELVSRMNNMGGFTINNLDEDNLGSIRHVSTHEMIVSLIDVILHERVFMTQWKSNSLWYIFDERRKDTLIFSILFLLYNIYGVNPLDWLDETVREVESRTGTWDETKGKFVKELGAYSKEEAYEKAIKHGNGAKVELLFDYGEEWEFMFTDSNIADDKEGNSEFTVKRWYKAQYNIEEIFTEMRSVLSKMGEYEVKFFGKMKPVDMVLTMVDDEEERYFITKTGFLLNKLNTEYIKPTRNVDEKVKNYVKMINRIEEGCCNIKFNLENQKGDLIEVVSNLEDGYLSLSLLINKKKIFGYGSYMVIDSDYPKTLRIFSEDVVDKLYSMGYKLT